MHLQIHTITVLLPTNTNPQAYTWFMISCNYIGIFLHFTTIIPRLYTLHHFFSSPLTFPTYAQKNKLINIQNTKLRIINMKSSPIIKYKINTNLLWYSRILFDVTLNHSYPVQSRISLQKESSFPLNPMMYDNFKFQVP